MSPPLLLSLLLASAACTRPVRALGPWRWQQAAPPATRLSSEPHIPDGCQVQWFTQRLNHNEWTAPAARRTFQQRYFVCRREAWRPGAPIFFYAGNEGPVTGYINATGLMWEHAEEFGALLLWAEHRYYGHTQPFGKDSWRVNPTGLTFDQALSDYAAILTSLTHEWGAQHSPVIAFGGSYGGMLAGWLRRLYPHLVDGAVAASAPMGSFPGTPGWDPSRFWQVVTRDASEVTGAAPGCVDTTRAAFAALLNAGRSAAGRAQLRDSFRLCDSVQSEDDVLQLAYWVQGAFDAFSMGHYPYPSSYMTGDYDHPLPAWPMRAACSEITRPASTLAVLRRGDEAEEAEGLFGALRRAAAVLYNATGTERCFALGLAGPAAGAVGVFDWQWCTAMAAQELPYFPANGRTDMFWDQGPFNLSVINAHCLESWGVTPDPDWAVVQYGGLDWRGTSNIVFSNGLLDPWSAYGVLSDVSDTVVAVLIEEGAHHLDLMFSHPADPLSVIKARQVELQHIRRWVEQAQREKQPGRQLGAS